MAACRSNSDAESRARRWHVDGPSRAQAEETAAFHQKQFHGHLGFWFLTPSYVFFFSVLLLRFVAPLRCCIALHRAPCAAFRVSTNDISEAGYTELKDGTLTSLLRQLLDEWFGISICADDLTSVRNTASCIARVSLGGILHQEAESRSGPVNQPAAVLECRTQIEASGSQLIQVIPGLIGDQNHASGGFIGTEVGNCQTPYQWPLQHTIHTDMPGIIDACMH